MQKYLISNSVYTFYPLVSKGSKAFALLMKQLTCPSTQALIRGTDLLLKEIRHHIHSKTIYIIIT